MTERTDDKHGEWNGKWCTYCRADTHNDKECSCTRPADWHPGKYIPVDAGWLRTSAVPSLAAPDDVRFEKVMLHAVQIVNDMETAWHDSDEEHSGHYMDAASRIAAVLLQRSGHPAPPSLAPLSKIIDDLMVMRKGEAEGVMMMANSDDTLFEDCIRRLKELASTPPSPQVATIENTKGQK